MILAFCLKLRLPATIKTSKAQRTTRMHAFVKQKNKNLWYVFEQVLQAALCFLPVFCFCSCCYDFAPYSTDSPEATPTADGTVTQRTFPSEKFIQINGGFSLAQRLTHGHRLLIFDLSC